MRRSQLWVGALLLTFAWAAPTAYAQDDTAGDPPLEAEGDTPADPDTDVPPPPDPIEARLERLEQGQQERDQQLATALQRVDELERELEAADAADAAAEEADADGEEEPNTDPTIRPLASFFTRFEHREGYADLGAGNPGCFPGANDGDCLRYRARLGIEVGNLRVSDEVVASVRLVPQVAGFWAFGGTSGGVTHPALGLYEGQLILAIEDTVRLEIGRIVLNYGDQLVIGALGWHPAARSFDGARIRLTPDDSGLYVDAFWTMLGEGGPGGFGQGDGYFYGVYAGLGPAIDSSITLDAYAFGLQANDSTDPATGTNIDWSLLVHLGSRFRTRIDMIDLRAEGGLQLGRLGLPDPADPRLILAGHIDGEIGVNLLDDRLRFGLEGLYASGDGPSTNIASGYTQLFPTAHAFLGLSDVMGARTNASSVVAHVLGRPIPQLTFKLDVHVFVRNRVMGGDNYAGTEGDLQAIWVPGAGFRLRGLYALFIPNDGAWAPGADPVHYMEVELGYQLN